MKFGYFTGSDPEALRALVERAYDSRRDLPLGGRDLTQDEHSRTSSNEMIGIELGNAKVRAALVEGGFVGKSCVLDVPSAASQHEIIGLLARAAQEVEAKPSAVGLAIPGEVDENGRCWGIASFPGFDGVHIGEELAARLNCPVSIESEGFAAALCERLHGHGRGHLSTLTVVLGQRMSAGVLIDGQLQRGSSGFGGSIAHLQLDPSPGARPCECGRRGCLEQYASVHALLSEYERRSGVRAFLAEVLERAQAGDEAANSTISGVASALGTAFALAQNLLDLSAVVLVTPEPGLFRIVEPEVRARLRELVFGSASAEVPVFASERGLDAVIVGAADLAAQIALA